MGVVISLAMGGTGIGIHVGEMLGDRFGYSIVRERGLRGWRAYEERQIVKQHMTRIGAVGGAVWGGLLGAELQVVDIDGSFK